MEPIYNRTPTNSELYHHGILGQRWGRRRYQYADGSLTPEGRKRYGVAGAIIERHNKKLASKEAASDTSSKLSGTKKTSDMTDDELRAKAARLELEKRVLQLDRDVASLTPKHMTTGQKLVASMQDVAIKSVIQASQNVLTDYLTKAGKEMLGLKTENNAKKLKKKGRLISEF